MLENCIKKRLLVIAVTAVISCGSMAALFAKEYVLGGKNGWPVFQQQENITTGKGRYGYDCIQLASNSFVFDEYTDLLIDFEDAQMPISDGDYTINRNNFQVQAVTPQVPLSERRQEWAYLRLSMSRMPTRA